ncbi:ring-cleaving dioxygenase [Alsobacter sp. SYSU M60028]|uniref:Ring-cleaving dioxygenase n=1 Tax=Alsobacter ponti TaxID=2962936 RepID=A0ABT1LBY6_9HYPH|nr:ring-cleaving dioxygenase [Alsobacter ponti]MCP8939016.1 ring-cleaving dioxygenase [Alsobacter ponti]
MTAPSARTASPGLHHVTAIAGAPRRNLAFYTGLMGLRLVKKTVNFDDPGTWHLYYGDAAGTPGSILTFFPWPNAAPGRVGPGETGETSFVAPEGSLGFWRERLAQAGVATEDAARFGRPVLTFADPDGMRLAIAEGAEGAGGPAWTGADAPAEAAIRGFAGVTLGVREPARTAAVLTGIFGYEEIAEDGPRQRFAASGDGLGGVIDLVTVEGERGRLGAGTVHHIAFRARDDAEQAAMAERLRAELGIATTEQKDRNYFRSVYFREPGGVLFEIATDEPGFAVDEPAETMGSRLMLPAQYEARRARIEAVLPPL